MARRLRIEFPGAVYYLVSRGNRGEVVFRAEEDYAQFVGTLGEACGKTGWEVHAYCLLPGEVQLLVEAPRSNLVMGMKWLLGTYTHRQNRRHGVSGHLFGGRYRSVVVEGRGEYLREAGEAIHLSPAREGIIGEGERLERHGWSSYGLYLAEVGRRPCWLRVDRLLAEAGVPDDSQAGRVQYGARMERCRREDVGGSWLKLQGGWLHGSERFRREVLAAMEDGISGTVVRGRKPRQADEVRAERILEEALAELGWSVDELAGHPKTAAEKLAMARRLRAETVMPLGWIAERLQMGSFYTLRNALLSGKAARQRKGRGRPEGTGGAGGAGPEPLRLPPPAEPGAPEGGFNVEWD